MEYREADALLKAMAAKVAATAKELSTLANIPGFNEALAAHFSNDSTSNSDDGEDIVDDVSTFLSDKIEALKAISDSLSDIDDNIALDLIVDEDEDYDEEEPDGASSSPLYKVRAILGL